jgi:hypothetical protein
MRRGVRVLLGAAIAAATVAVGVPGAALAASGWTVQPVPLPAGATIGAMTGVSCASAADCEAVMQVDGSIPAAEGWDGTAWTLQTVTQSENEDYPQSVSCSSATNCMAAGWGSTSNSGVAWANLWNGSTWTDSFPLRFPGSRFLGVSCPSAASCTAVGYGAINNAGGPLAERWNGKVWKDEPVPQPSQTGLGVLNSVSCVSAADCVAVGVVAGPQSANQVLAYRWDGKSWTQQTLPAPAGAINAHLSGVSCTSASNCMAVGNSGPSGGAGTVMFAEHWNGSTWAAKDLPLPAGATGGGLASVSCVSARCTAAGQSFYPTSSRQRGTHALAESFNGTSWTVQATAVPSSHKLFTGVSCAAASTCTAVGSTFVAHQTGRTQPIAEHE